MLEKLAKQTAIYGISTIAVRFLSYLLTPYYTRIFGQETYGIVTDIYALIPLALTLLTMGMESSYFRFSAKAEEAGGDVKAAKRRLFATTWGVTSLAAAVFFLATAFFRDGIARMMGEAYVAHPEYVVWVGLIILFDVWACIPFSRLREQGRAMTFVGLKAMNVVLNVVLAFGFGAAGLFASDFGVGWVFVANLIASVVTWLAILGTADRTVPKINWALLAAIVVVGAVVAAYASGTANNKEPQVQVTPTPEPTQIPTPTPTATPDPTPSPTPKGPRYVVYAENVSWTQAQQRCEELGGTLAVPLTEDEYNEIVRVCTSAKCNYVWLGAERQADGNWRDTNGEIITFFRWDEGEPSGIDIGDNAPENFLMMWRREDGWYYNDSRENPLLDFYAFYGDNVGFVCQMW